MNISPERIPFLNDFAVKEHPLMEHLAMRWRGKKVGRNCRRKCFEKKSFLFPSATFFQRTHTHFFIYLLAFCSIHKAFWVGKIIVVFLSVLFFVS